MINKLPKINFVNLREKKTEMKTGENCKFF